MAPSATIWLSDSILLHRHTCLSVRGSLPLVAAFAGKGWLFGVRLWCAGRERALPYPGSGPPVFISGCNRGGTSIFSQLLGHHPELRNVGRGEHHEGQWIWHRRFYDWSRHRWAVEPWVRRMRKTAADATPARIAYFRRVFAAACPEGRLLEKTPANAVRIPFIDRLFPDCYVIHVLRDGRHTTASLMARGVDIRYAPWQWVGAHSIALPDLEKLGPERGLVVRYEDLLADAMQVLLRICRHCRLDDGPAAQQALCRAVDQHLQTPLDRWSSLQPAQRRHILEAIHPLQSRLGYPVEE